MKCIKTLLMFDLLLICIITIQLSFAYTNTIQRIIFTIIGFALLGWFFNNKWIDVYN